MDSLDCRREWTRRRLFRRGAELSALATVPAFLGACGSDDEGAEATGTGSQKNIAGTIVFYNWPEWAGDKEYAWFEKKYPRAKVKEVAEAASSNAAIVSTISRSKGDYDVALAGLGTAEQLDAAGLLAPFDAERCPNVSNMPQPVRDAFPFGTPADIGKTGFAYRKDLISERPESWADLWMLAKKYSGKVTMFKYDTDVVGAALLYTGHDVNSRDQAALDDAKEALLEIKPHLRAFLSTNFAKPLVDGTAYLGVSYDYYVADAQKKDPNIVWVEPSEGMPAYIEGRCPLKHSENLDTVYAFLNESMNPKTYANFVNTTGSPYLMPAAEQYIDKSIRDSSALGYDPETFKAVRFLNFTGAEGLARLTKMWTEVLEG